MTTTLFRRVVVFSVLGAIALTDLWHPNAPAETMQMYLPKVTLPAVIIAGAIDGINPCAFTVLLLFITAMLATLQAGDQRNITSARERLLGMGGIYIAAVFLTYLALGVGLLKSLDFFTRQHVPARLGALFAILFGLWMLKDVFLPDVGWRLQAPAQVTDIARASARKATAPALIVVGFLIAASARPALNRLAHWNLHHKQWVRLALGGGVVAMGLLILATV